MRNDRLRMTRMGSQLRPCQGSLPRTALTWQTAPKRLMQRVWSTSGLCASRKAAMLLRSAFPVSMLCYPVAHLALSLTLMQPCSHYCSVSLLLSNSVLSHARMEGMSHYLMVGNRGEVCM